MSSSLLTKEGKSVCVVRQRHRSSYLVYKLEKEVGLRYMSAGLVKQLKEVALRGR